MACSSAGVHIAKARVPRRSKKRIGGDQRTGADARQDGELRSRARAREADHRAGAEGPESAAARQCEDVERFARAQGAKSLRHGRRGQLRKPLVATEYANRHRAVHWRMPVREGRRFARDETGTSVKGEHAHETGEQDHGRKSKRRGTTGLPGERGNRGEGGGGALHRKDAGAASSGTPRNPSTPRRG